MDSLNTGMGSGVGVEVSDNRFYGFIKGSLTKGLMYPQKAQETQKRKVFTAWYRLLRDASDSNHNLCAYCGHQFRELQESGGSPRLRDGEAWPPAYDQASDSGRYPRQGVL